jgi:16S rRNA G966 N2-methylase RsmD
VIKQKSNKGRVYIHIADELQREPAKQIQTRLKEADFGVVGIQNVGGRAYIPDTAEVRFFAYADPPLTKQAADEIVVLLKKAGVLKPRSSYVIPSARERQGSIDITTHFEIWFAKDSFPGKTAN